MEYRFAPELRVPTDEGIITLQVVTFGQPDEYGTEWMPGVFTDFLNRSRPTFYFSHNGSIELRHVVGQGTTWQETDLGYTIDFQLDDFEAVPSARQVYAQAKSKTLRWASVGFERQEWMSRKALVEAGIIGPDEQPNLMEQMIKADLPHVAILSEPGAVVGAGVLAVRQPPIVVQARSGVVPVSFAHDLAAMLAAKSIDLEEALHRLKAYTPEEPEPPVPEPTPEEPPVGEPPAEPPEDPREVGPSLEDQEAETEAVEAEALIAAGMVGRSRMRPAPRAAVAAHDTAVQEGTWDGPAAVAAMPNDAATLAYCASWRDPKGTPDAKSTYKLWHHRTKGGPAIGGGIRAALSRLPQTIMPDADRPAVERHLRKHLDKLTGG
jgi:hypothetical protein